MSEPDGLYIGLDQIPGTRLFISGVFTLTRRAALKAANITHIVSVLNLQPAATAGAVSEYTRLRIDIDDVEDENILQYFKQTNDFIAQGLASAGGVLVHCAMGKSRSATVCAAYLMKTLRLTPEEAVARIRQARPIVEPNEGFMQQLELYHRMDMTDDVEASPVYQRWMYQREVKLSRDCNTAPSVDKIRFEDEHVASDSKDAVAEFELKCRKCRTKLATSQFVIPHHQPPHNKPFPTMLTCAHWFIDPLAWMRPELEQGKLEGRLECLKCKSNVGKYAWQGMRCTCGAWVVPAVTLHKAKIDQVKVGNRDGSAALRRGPGVGMPISSAEGRGLL